MRHVDRVERQPKIARDVHLLSCDGFVQKCMAVLDLQLIRAALWHFQSERQIVRHMIATDSDHAAVFDDAAGIDHVTRRATAHVNDQRTQFFLSG